MREDRDEHFNARPDLSRSCGGTGSREIPHPGYKARAGRCADCLDPRRG